MSWVKEAISAIADGRTVDIRPQGGSMRGRIENGQRVTLTPIDYQLIEIGDIVLVRWKGNYLLHLVKELTEEQALIGNNLGKINGWAARSDILARVTEIYKDPGSHPTG